MARTLIIAIVATGLAAVGCGSDTVDAGKVEAAIQKDLSSPTAPLTSVSCPDDVEKDEGAKFTCSAKLEGGGKAKVEVTQTGNVNSFTYAFEPGTLVLTDDTVEPILEKDLAASGAPDTKVDCPDTIKVKAGEIVTCTATGSGGRQTALTFTFTSDDGTIDESSVETADS